MKRIFIRASFTLVCLWALPVAHASGLFAQCASQEGVSLPIAKDANEAANQKKVMSCVRTLKQNAFQAHLLACETSTNTTVAAGQKPTPAQWQILGPCLKSNREAARSQCATDNKITLPAKGFGQNLSAQERKEIHTCMAQKGYYGMHHWGRKLHKQLNAPSSASGSQPG